MAVKKIKKNTAAFYLTDEVTEALEEKAKKTGISKSEIVEQYLTQAIIDKDQEKKPMIITIMSFKGGVAKTTSAASLAICLAQDNNKVLIIDLDGQGSISQYLGVYDQTAEADCIADIMLTNTKGQRKTILEIAQPTEYENVDIVPSNFRFSDADARMRNESSQSSIDSRLRFAIEDAIEETQYDYVIIDCPPLGLVIDAAIIARECDGAILVVESSKTKYRLAQEVKGKLELTGIPILGVVLNKVERKKNKGYYSKYYGKNYKKKGYGEYYAADTAGKKSNKSKK